MKILGKVIKQEKIIQTLRPVLKLVCDRCGKELTNQFARVSTSHQRWGIDSLESAEKKDLCFNCAKVFFTEYVDNRKITDHFVYEVFPVEPELSPLEVRADGTPFIGDTIGDIEEYEIEED